jgi:hypothetical protein
MVCSTAWDGALGLSSSGKSVSRHISACWSSWDTMRRQFWQNGFRKMSFVGAQGGTVP